MTKRLRVLFAVLVSAALLLGGCDDGESDDADRPETTAGIPTAGRTELARAVMEDGRRIVLESAISESAVEDYANVLDNSAARAALPTPCLALSGIGPDRRQCGSPYESETDPAGHPVVVDSIRAGAIAQVNPSAPLEIFGPTPASTEVVMVDYEAAGVQERLRAVVFLATNGERLRRAGFRAPFGYFFAELPPDAERVRATAWSESKRLGIADFDQLIPTAHPHVFIEGRV